MTDLDSFAGLVARDHGLVVVSVLRPDSTISSSVVNAGVLQHPLTGGPVIGAVIQGGALKLAHFRRTGRATITFRAGWEWVSVDGQVMLLGPDDPHAGWVADRLPGLLRDIFSAAGGTHDDWPEYDRVMAAERRVAVLITPSRVLGSG